MGTTAGYQRHPGTNTAHFFAANSKVSACKREYRTNDGKMIESTDFMVCSRCGKTEARKHHQILRRAPTPRKVWGECGAGQSPAKSKQND